jgi:cation transport protein ChaC
MGFDCIGGKRVLGYRNSMDATVPQFWVFGYGSLMWRPGFDFLERRAAVVFGYHRSLCVYSHVHRGSPERPGLVMGLDRGGSCRGAAFRVAPDAWADTLAYLRGREQVTMVYRETRLPARLDDGSPVAVLAYTVDRGHGQYAGKLTLEQQLDFISQGHGQSGHCRDYVLNTLQHLREAGSADRRLEQLARRLASHAAISV